MNRFLKWLGIIILALVLINFICAAAIFCWMKWTGVKEWHRVQAELRAKGEPLTFAELVPPPPPDSENFFADPMWRQLHELTPHLEKGVRTWGPDKIPDEKLLINQWNTPLSENELGQFQSIFPNEQLSPRILRDQAIRRLAALLEKTSAGNSEKISRLILELAQPATPVLQQIFELSKRPSSFFPIGNQVDVYTSLPHISPLLNIAKLFDARALAETGLSQTDAASQDVKSLQNLSKVLRNEPIIISLMVDEKITNLSLKTLNRGFSRHLWNEEALKTFQHSLCSLDFSRDLTQALRGERASMNATSLVNLYEIGDNEKTPLVVKIGEFFAQEGQKAFFDEFMQNLISFIRTKNTLGFNIHSFPPEVQDSKDHPFQFIRALPTLLNQHGTRNAVKRTIETQTQINQSLIACVLERYYLIHGSYPISLEALVPEYLDMLPLALTTGKQMQYRLIDPQHFLLWCPGWKLETLNGKPGEFSGEGDIVWNQKMPLEARPEAHEK